nr:putative capsid [Marmot picobirnavirus]AVX53792.1 putative capsid [Marmot picobirnavirus]
MAKNIARGTNDHRSKCASPNKGQGSRQDRQSVGKQSNDGSRHSKPKYPLYGDKSGRVSDSPEIFRNEPGWYYTNPGIMDSAIRINYEEFVGKRYQVTNQSSFSPVNILTYLLNPTPNRRVPGGYNGAAEDPGALWAARRLYSALSSVTGRTSNYTPNTLAFLFFAIGEMLSMYSYIRRVFGYYRTYNRRNWGIPKSLFTAMGVDFEDFQQNVANYLTEFNTIIVDMQKIPILQSVTYFAKCVALYDSVYADMDADMAQLFLCAPASTWVLREDGSSVWPAVHGTVLETHSVASSMYSGMQTQKLSAFLDLIRLQLKNLMESTTLNIVYADILNYASKNGVRMLYVPTVGTDYAVPVVYNASICQQMHHAMQIGTIAEFSGQPDENGMITAAARNIDGTDATVKTTPRNDVIESADFEYSYNPLTRLYFPVGQLPDITTKYWDIAVLQALMYDSDRMDETLDERVDNTRYMVERNALYLGTDTTVSGRAIFNHTTSGDHSVVSIWMTAVGENNLTFVRTQVPVAWVDSTIRLLARIQPLALPPLMWAFSDVKLDDGSVGLELAGAIGDLKNVTFLDPSVLRSANQLIERALFDVRDLKSFTG